MIILLLWNDYYVILLLWVYCLESAFFFFFFFFFFAQPTNGNIYQCKLDKSTHIFCHCTLHFVCKMTTFLSWPPIGTMCYFARTSSWWRHQMETVSALLALCAGNSPVPVISPHKGQWRGALMFSLIYAWINDWVNNREAGDLRRQRGHYDVIVMFYRYCDDPVQIIDMYVTDALFLLR